jgi:hypothetical protein
MVESEKEEVNIAYIQRIAENATVIMASASLTGVPIETVTEDTIEYIKLLIKPKEVKK